MLYDVEGWEEVIPPMQNGRSIRMLYDEHKEVI